MRISIAILTFISCLRAFACSEAMQPFTQECKAQDLYLLNFSSPNVLYNFNPIGLEYRDLLKMHKSLFEGKILFSHHPDIGKLRVENGETNPKMIFTCEDKKLNQSLLNLLDDYDLQSNEGYPLLVLEKTKQCADKNFYSSTLVFYKGASIKIELNRWLVDFNDTLARYETNNDQYNIAPYKYLADMRRWFLVLKPFNFGNEEVVDTLVDYACNRLQLPRISLNENVSPIFLSVLENRNLSIKNFNAPFVLKTIQEPTSLK